MSDSDRKPTVIRAVSELIETRVESAWQAIESGHRAASVFVTLADRHSLDFNITAEPDEGLFRRWIPEPIKNLLNDEPHGKIWTIRSFPSFTPCPDCTRYIESLSSKVFNKEGAMEFVSGVVDQLRLSRCYETVDVPAREDEGTRIKLVAETRKPRIKILDSESPITQGSLPIASPAPGSVKVARPTEIEAPRTATRITVSDRTREAQRDEDLPYSAPSIPYELASGERVEVTIPLSVCEKLIEHCSASRRHGREVGGILVGIADERPMNRPTAFGYQAVVTDLIEVTSSDSSGSHICFDENTWRNVNREMETKFEPNKRRRLGWYHTHPTQGIFFSGQDLDAHETFGKPFQFALVIDPRKMEAGLFYWREGRGSSLGGPILFMLTRERDLPTLPEDRAEAESRERDEQGPLSGFRVLLLLSIASLAVIFVARNSGFLRIDPNHSCVLAFLAFLGLRMWNARFFHPVEPVESMLANKLAAGIAAGLSMLGRAVLRIPLIIRFPIVILLLGALVVFVGRQGGGPIQNPARHDPNAPGSSGQKGGKPPDTAVRRLSVTYDPDGSAIDIAMPGDPPVKVSYRRPPAEGYTHGGAWYPEPVESEQLFFKALFQWDITSRKKSDSVRDLQTRLGLTQADGVWGDSTRSALLKAIELMSSEETLTVLVPGNKSATVGFEKNAGAVVSDSTVANAAPQTSSEASGASARKRTPKAAHGSGVPNKKTPPKKTAPQKGAPGDVTKPLVPPAQKGDDKDKKATPAQKGDDQKKLEPRRPEMPGADRI